VGRTAVHKGTIGSAVKRAQVSLARFLLPNACIVCERMVEQSTPDDVVCAVCRSRMKPVAEGCDRCAQPLPPVGPCRLCADWPVGLVRVRSAVWLGKEARGVVHGLKYKGFTRLGALAASEIARREKPAGTVIIPIPLGQKRLRQRGYNQSAYIARALGEEFGMPVLEDVLIRSKETRSQTELTPDERLVNVSGAFRVTMRPVDAVGPLETTPLEAVLVDDVFTTGATMVAAAECLLASGWHSVGGITFARARTFADNVLALG